MVLLYNSVHVESHLTQPGNVSQEEGQGMNVWNNLTARGTFIHPLIHTMVSTGSTGQRLVQ